MQVLFKGKTNLVSNAIVGKITRDSENANNKILIIDDINNYEQDKQPLAFLTEHHFLWRH